MPQTSIQKTSKGKGLGLIVKDLRPTPFTTLVAIFLLTIVSRVTKNGTIYNLDYSLFQPDGVRYHALSLHFMGHSWVEISREIQNFYILHAYRWDSAPDFISGTSSAVSIAWSRPLYSFLSVPFVLLFGQWGMLFIPALGIFVIALVLLKAASIHNQPWTGVLLFFVLTSSSTFVRWTFINYTDSLSLALFFLIFFLVFYSRQEYYFSFLVSALTVLILLARPNGLFICAFYLILFRTNFRNHKKLYILNFCLSFIWTLSLLLSKPFLAEYASGGGPTGGFFGQLKRFPENLVKVPLVEIGQLVILDRILLAYLVLAVILVLLNFRTVIAKLSLLFLLVSIFQTIWIGALGINFRLSIVSLAPLSLLVIEHMSSKTKRV